MNDNILCLYYSRTGNTKKAMEEVAEALDCECLEIRDKVDRSGTMGYLRCCFDAMHKRTSAVSRPKCQKCWAKFYCSGGCSAANYNMNHDMNDSYDLGCEMERKRLECAIYLKAMEKMSAE